MVHKTKVEAVPQEKQDQEWVYQRKGQKNPTEMAWPKYTDSNEAGSGSQDIYCLVKAKIQLISEREEGKEE